MSRPKQETKTIRCAIYSRKSTTEGLEQEFNSLDAQRESCEAFITSMKHEGWTCLPEHYDDGGFTGGNMDRPGLKRLMAAIEAGEVDCVVVYKVDRLSRSLLDFARMMEVFDRKGISFVSVTQQFNTTHSMGRLTLNILLSFAQFEREIISERTRDKMAAARRKGKWVGGVPILGYDVVHSKLVVNELEAVRVRQIFELFLRKPSMMELVKELESRDWRNKSWITRKAETKGGNAFDRIRLQALLTNVAYIGQVKYKEEICSGEHPRIVPIELFEKVQAKLARKRNHTEATYRNQFGALLKGLIRCTACNSSMVPSHTKRQGNKRYRYYTCSKAQKRGWHTCPAKSVPAPEIERAVVEQIQRIGQDEELLAATLAQLRAQVEQRIDALQQERLGMEANMGRRDAELRGLLPGSEATQSRMAYLQDQISQAERRLEQIADELTALRDATSDESALREAFERFGDIWEDLTTIEQIRLINLLVERIDYNGRTGDFEILLHETGIQTFEQELALLAEEHVA